MKKRNRMANFKLLLQAKFEKLAQYLFIGFSVLLLVSVWKNATKINQASKRADVLQQRVEDLKNENRDLKKKTEDIGSSDFIETQLRNNLGFSKTGETVIVLPEESIIRSYAPPIKEETPSRVLANWEKWVELFK